MQYRIPLGRADLPNSDEVVADLRDIFTRGRVGNYGPMAERFEAEAAKWLGTDGRDRILMGVTSGDAALRIGFECLHHRVMSRTCAPPRGRRPNMVIPNWTFQSTINSALTARWDVILGPTNPKTLCLDVNALSEALASKKGVCVDAVCVTNVSGCTLSTFSIGSFTGYLGKNEGPRPLIAVDAAHSFRPGRQSLGDMAAFSLSGTKPVTCGEGGVLVLGNCTEFMGLPQRLRNYGFFEDYNCPDPRSSRGMNAKLDELRAAFAWRSMRAFVSERMKEKRAALAAAYHKALVEPGFVTAQQMGPDDCHKDFVVRFPTATDRLRVEDALRRKGIETRRYFRPLSSQKGYRTHPRVATICIDRDAEWDLYLETLCLPFSASHTASEIEEVCEIITAALHDGAA